MVRFTVITLFPEMLSGPISHSILKKAQDKGALEVHLVDLRKYARDRHRVTDDYPYGGGHGMVMKPEPLAAAIEELRAKLEGPHVVLLSPQGRVLTQVEASKLAQQRDLVLICGRYEGVDERVRSYIDDEISIGDYTLSGGEFAALVLIDAVARLVPGVLGNAHSLEEESFRNGLLEYPQYTRPETFRGMRVPDVLVSGDHERVRRWRREMSLQRTRERRPDLFARAALTPEERKRFRAGAGLYLALVHHPVYDKNGQVVTTALTNMDIHDIARSAKTYGVAGFYVITPIKTLQKLALKIIHHWEEGYGSHYNSTRKEALSLVRIRDTLDDAILEVERERGIKPALIATSARPGRGRTSFAAVKDMLISGNCPGLLLLGTGWGLTEAVLARSDYILEPIEGIGEYNHLSVRSATAIILDRLLGQR